MRVIVVGGGKVGTHLAQMLLTANHQVTLIESSADELPRLRAQVPRVILGNGADPAILESADVRATQVLAAVTGTDETNLVVCGLARFEFGVRRVLARVNHPKNAWLYTREMGVDVALNQADLIAHLIAEEISLGDMMTLLKLRKGEYALVEEKVHPQAPAAGKAVHQLTLPDRCVLAAVIRGGRLIIPRGNTVLQAADEVLALVHSDHAGQLAELLGSPSHAQDT